MWGPAIGYAPPHPFQPSTKPNTGRNNVQNSKKTFSIHLMHIFASRERAAEFESSHWKSVVRQSIYSMLENKLSRSPPKAPKAPLSGVQVGL